LISSLVTLAPTGTKKLKKSPSNAGYRFDDPIMLRLFSSSVGREGEEG
jgi:hypothetical protein